MGKNKWIEWFIEGLMESLVWLLPAFFGITTTLILNARRESKKPSSIEVVTSYFIGFAVTYFGYIAIDASFHDSKLKVCLIYTLALLSNKAAMAFVKVSEEKLPEFFKTLWEWVQKIFKKD